MSARHNFRLDTVFEDGEAKVQADIQGVGGDLVNLIASAIEHKEELYDITVEAVKRVARKRVHDNIGKLADVIKEALRKEGE